MRYAGVGIGEFKPHVVARHVEFFDMLQGREFVPMQMMH